MKSAYLYVRVSTDEQKRKGHSLAEQEDRLIRHCEINGIQVKGIYREDYSAKDFNRPEWKRLIKKLRKNTHRPPENILFIKWDRFSRNIEYAYQMIRMLRELNVQPMAVDQPIDLEIPESIVMLAVYLSIPEAENSRRGLTTSDGMRRAKKMGRWSGRAPIGYANRTTPDGKSIIVPKQPEADFMKWSFQQLATGSFTISQVRKMACINGLRCAKSHFWRLVHNPVYCGIIRIPANRNEEQQFVKAIHEPLISESLFQQVQLIITKDRNKRVNRDALKSLFPLRGFMSCPLCGCRITGSVSQGRRLKYPYYHCVGHKCKGRFRAELLNGSYEEKLKEIHLRPEAYELLGLILEDENVLTYRRRYIDERKRILDSISKQELHISKARKYFLDEKIDFDDFSKLKKEHNEILSQLNYQLNRITQKITDCDLNNNTWPNIDFTVLQSYKEQDSKGKRDFLELFTPTAINPVGVNIDSLRINVAVAMVVEYRK
ncbi:recombinase family protein [Chitinophaga sp. GCM10012297]|uniref:Recombinase family protein n=1 Tax=Chitinophaga chungangae TaxID=2821488 RepID=A0ABS3YK02_9BACT|nr:recombinase family protein [Chitinophaga chungangae]MBO9154991.1 recombinase family protein [Chitinophaga chungangae]